MNWPFQSLNISEYSFDYFRFTKVDTVGELLLSLKKQQFGIDQSHSQDLILAADLNVARVSA